MQIQQKKQTGETVQEQLKRVEEFLAKNNLSYSLLTSEIEKLQKLISSKAKKDVCYTSTEIGRNCKASMGEGSEGKQIMT